MAKRNLYLANSERGRWELGVAEIAILARQVALFKLDSLFEDAGSKDERDTLYDLLFVERQ